MLNQSEILKTAKKQYELFNNDHILGYAPLFVDTPGTLFLKENLDLHLRITFLERIKNFLYFKHKLIKISKLHNKTDYTNVVITFGFKTSFKIKNILISFLMRIAIILKFYGQLFIQISFTNKLSVMLSQFTLKRRIL